MNRLSTWGVGITALLLLTLACLWDYYPPIAGPQRFGIVLGGAAVGTREPLVVTGASNAGDFLFVQYAGENRVVFGYDSWGRGGPTSAPVAYTPGKLTSLIVDMPSLAAVSANPGQIRDRLVVTFDGITVLDGPVAFFQRRAQRASFGRNPLGGTSSGPVFSGRLLHADGRPLASDVRGYFSRAGRFVGWLWFGRWQVLAIMLFSATLAWGWHRGSSDRFAGLRAIAACVPRALHAHRAFLVTAAVGCMAFAAMITSGSFRLFFRESFGDFYDFQALSLLQGRLDVPAESLNGEAFVHDGKIYGYFGLTPALLRLPLVMFGVAFGTVSRAAMLAYYAATLVGAYLLLRDAARLLRPSDPRPAPWQTVLFTAHIGLGSTVFFLGSRAYIYHEAILCGIMLAVFSCWCTLRHLAQTSGRWWQGALLFGVLSVHARPPVGFFALTLLGCVAAAALLPAWRTGAFRALRRPLAIGLLAVAGVASFNAVSYAKFGTIEGCPLRLNVQYSPARLAKIDSKQFHLSNIPYGLASYFYRSTVEFAPHFPWLYLGPTLPPRDYPAAKLDLPDRTLALPYGMTGLFGLATLAGAIGCLRFPAARAPLFALWAATVPMTLAMAAAIATAERYTGDFVPFLIGGAAFGLAAVDWRPLAITFLAATTLWACALTGATTLHYQGAMVWGVPDEVKNRYEALRAHMDDYFVTPRGVMP